VVHVKLEHPPPKLERKMQVGRREAMVAMAATSGRWWTLASTPSPPSASSCTSGAPPAAQGVGRGSMGPTRRTSRSGSLEGPSFVPRGPTRTRRRSRSCCSWVSLSFVDMSKASHLGGEEESTSHVNRPLKWPGVRVNFTAPGPLPPAQGSFGSLVRCAHTLSLVRVNLYPSILFQAEGLSRLGELRQHLLATHFSCHRSAAA